jgi:hypothetical protein
LHSCRPSISLQMRSSFVTLIFDRLFSHVCSKQPSTHGMDLCNRSGRERHSSRDLSSRVYFKCRLMAVAGLDQPAGTAAPDRSCLCSCLPWPAPRGSGQWPASRHLVKYNALGPLVLLPRDTLAHISLWSPLDSTTT